jgi:hypothetical protein
MTRIHSLLGTVGLGALIAFGCSQDGPGVAVNTGGVTSAGGSSAGSGVTNSGAPGTGGTPAPSAGTSSVGGIAPVAGTSSGGAASGSSAGGASSAGTGGGSAGGAPPTGGSSGGLTAAEIVPGLNGFYWEGTCDGSIAVEGHNCPMSLNSSSCPTNGINREKTLPVMGTAGQMYTINIEVRGVVGTRCYKDGMRASTAALDETGNNNWWYAGGSYANPTGWWNTYELHVSPTTGDASGDVYYFNGSDVQGGNSCEREATYLIKYNASFKVKGGGMLTFKIHDQNCKGQQNCGSNPDGTSACAPRTVDLAGMSASPPMGFTQPPSNGQYKPQWMLIGVTSITSP